MKNPAVPAATVRRKKLAILGCGILLYFLTCMAKVLIPAVIFDDLIKCGLDSRMIASTGAFFMYAYAASQLFAGVFSNRYGGVRILFYGGTLFAIGTIGFPWVKFYPLMLACRVITGLGAGTVFLGVVKLISDLFSEKFGVVLGTIMLVTYFGPACGTTPMVLLVKAIGWQWAMAIPGIAALFGTTLIVTFMKGTLKPVVRGETLQPLFIMFRNREMWLLCMTAPVTFGAYYIISSQIGIKSLADHCGLSSERASAIIMALTVVVAVTNVAGNLGLKLCGNRRKPMTLITYLFTFSGAVIAYFAFKCTTSAWMVAAGFAVVAMSAGFFPLYSTVAKEVNPPEQTGLAVALLNFWCFVFIALFQNISGHILQRFTAAGSTVFQAQAYCAVFIFIAAVSIYAVFTGFFVRETRPEKNGSLLKK